MEGIGKERDLLSISFNISLTFESNQCFIYLYQYNYNNKEGEKPKMAYKQKQVNLEFFISNLQHEHKNASIQGTSEHGLLYIHSYVVRTAKKFWGFTWLVYYLE